MSCVTHMNGSCHTYEMSHVTHMNTSVQNNVSTNEYATSHMNESCDTYAYDVSKKESDTRVNDSCFSYLRYSHTARPACQDITVCVLLSPSSFFVL